MKKLKLKSCDIRFNFHTEKSILYYSTYPYKPKKEVSIKYGFWDYASSDDLIEKLEKNEKLMKNLRKIALQKLKESRKRKYIELSQGQALEGKHILKITFEFVNIKYEKEKMKGGIKWNLNLK